MANQRQHQTDGVDGIEILRGAGIEIILKHERGGIQFGFRGQGLTPEYDFWRGDRESLLRYLLGSLNVVVRSGRIVEV